MTLSLLPLLPSYPFFESLTGYSAFRKEIGFVSLCWLCEDGVAPCGRDILGIAEKFWEGKRWGKFFISIYLILINRTVEPVWVQTVFRCGVCPVSPMKQHFQEQDYKGNKSSSLLL